MEAIVRKKHTYYRFHPVGGKPIPLGNDREEAIRKVLDMGGRAPHAGTLRWVWEKYSTDRRFLKLADATRDDYATSWKSIDKVLGDMQIAEITARIIAKYVRIERADAPVRANREKSVLSNLFAFGIDLGACDGNPAKLVRPNEEEARAEAPAVELMARFLAWVETQTPQRRIVGLAAEYASLAGSRKVEFLDLAWPQVDRVAGEVRVFRAKQRGKKRGEIVDVIGISPALDRCLTKLEAIRVDGCLHVFPTRDRTAYSARGFKTLWQRIMVKAMLEGVVPPEARFTFHDIRAFYATEHKRTRGDLPDMHKNPQTTARVYDRNKEVKRRAI